MAESFRDHFSGHAELYASARPTYPNALFEWLVDLVERRELAWDAATGNGQAALALKPFFTRIHASDASAEQIASAPEVEGIDFCAEPAETPSLREESVDLVTVAQAAHWFDLPRFYEGVKRVLHRDGVLALWCYEHCAVSPDIDEVIQDYYQFLDPYWPPQRALVESRYETLEFPFEEISAPSFHMSLNWSRDQLVAYLESWSATQRAAKALDQDPLLDLKERLRSLWDDDVRAVSWPIAMRIGRRA